MGPLSKLLHLNKVKTVYFCAGSRNATLEKELCEHFEIIHHYEERQSSFMALGQANQSQVPVAICTTSGTAALECLPAIAEAFFGQSKVILITADRPTRLRDTGAPQTLDQITPFSSYVRKQIDCTLDELMDEITEISFLEYPVQLNIKIDDATAFYPQHKYSNCESLNLSDFEDFLDHYNPLIILTHGYAEKISLELIQKFLASNYIVHVEKTSNVYLDQNQVNLLQFEKDLDRCVTEGLVDSVLRIGHTPLTRLWRDLDRKYTSIPVFHIDPRGLQGIARGKVLKLHNDNLSSLIPYVEKFPKKNAIRSQYSLPKYFEDFPLSELSFFEKLNQLIPTGSKVYLGNSMPIRYWQMIPYRQHELYFNRGANGIDGQIASAIGVARSCSQKVYAIIGDLTALYDLSCLFLSVPENLHILIINNYGGRIFEIVGHTGKILNQHSSSITSLLGDHQVTAQYNHPDNIELDATVIELFPSLDQTRAFWSEWRKSDE